MGRGKKGQRSGNLWKREREKRSGKTQTPDEMTAAFEAMCEGPSIQTMLAGAREYANVVEAAALEVFGRHGLPSLNGLYGREAGGPWEARSLAREPGGPWESVSVAGPHLGVGSQTAWLEKVGEFDHPADTEVGFAVTLLSSVGRARRFLDKAEAEQNFDALEGFHAGAGLTMAPNGWREEFVLGDMIWPTKNQRRGRCDGGDARAKVIRAERKPEWARWQTEADTIWRVSPSMTTASVAATVVTRLKLNEKADTVARRIRKPGGS